MAPSPSSGAAQTSALAPESDSTYSISSALSSACTGTATPPSASTPKYASGKCGVLGSSSATLSPGPTPRSRRTAAYCRLCAHSWAYVSRRSPRTTAVRSACRTADSARMLAIDMLMRGSRATGRWSGGDGRAAGPSREGPAAASCGRAVDQAFGMPSSSGVEGWTDEGSIGASSLSVVRISDSFSVALPLTCTTWTPLMPRCESAE